MDNSKKPAEDEEKPVTCAQTGRRLTAGKNILEVREVMVAQGETNVVPLPGSLFFSGWKELVEFAAESQAASGLKRRVP